MKIAGFILAASCAAATGAQAQDAALCAQLRQQEAELAQSDANYTAAIRTLNMTSI